MANRWLVKTEPTEFSWSELVREQRTAWTGVANALARQHLRGMAVGDQVLVYHTGSERAVVGIAKVARAAYPDPRSKDERAVVVDLVPVQALKRPVLLAELQGLATLKDWELIRMGRLSVMPVPDAAWSAIDALSRGR